MSTFENENYRWRETYFVMFSSENRPTAQQIEKTLGELSRRCELQSMQGDDQQRFESVTLLSPDDFAALDICYIEGAEVVEQTKQIIEEMREVSSAEELAEIEQLGKYDARIDVLHFEEISPDAFSDSESDEPDEMFDPSSLLVVMEELAKLTSGAAFDPQSGTLLNDN